MGYTTQPCGRSQRPCVDGRDKVTPPASESCFSCHLRFPPMFSVLFLVHLSETRQTSLSIPDRRRMAASNVQVSGTGSAAHSHPESSSRPSWTLLQIHASPSAGTSEVTTVSQSIRHSVWSPSAFLVPSLGGAHPLGYLLTPMPPFSTVTSTCGIRRTRRRQMLK